MHYSNIGCEETNKKTHKEGNAYIYISDSLQS